MPIAVVRTVAPAFDPVSLERAKSHLRVSGNDDDDEIALKLAGAVSAAQRECERQFARATFRLLLDDFPRGRGEADGSQPGTIRLPLGPVGAVESVAYTDADGAPQTVSTVAYHVGTATGRVVPLFGGAWPATNRAPENVSITFTAGWATAGEVPADAVSAVLLILGDRWENRGDGLDGADRDIPPAAKRLLRNLAWAEF
jgi:uncharacterized phiE125 gp8 family phage protein